MCRLVEGLKLIHLQCDEGHTYHAPQTYYQQSFWAALGSKKEKLAFYFVFMGAPKSQNNMLTFFGSQKSQQKRQDIIVLFSY